MKTFLTILPILLFVAAQAQTKISGVVKATNGESIPGANIFIQDTYDGTSSYGDGKFEFTSTETGGHVLVVKFVGYKEFRQEITLNGSHLIVNARLQEEISELASVTITAGSFTASDASRRTVFRAVDIATTAGATADIAGALNTLPGTQKVGESGRLFVRGGDGIEAKTFIDGILVFDAYNASAPNTPASGRFLPFMFKGTSFSTGGYSAEYGQALSSALILDSKDESEISRTDFGLLSVGGDVAHTHAWQGGSAAVKAQYIDLRPYYGLLKQEIDWKSPAQAVEGITAFRQHVGKDGMLKFYSNINNTDFALYRHDIDDYTTRSLYDVSNKYRYANASYRDGINDNWAIRGGASYSAVRNTTLLDAMTINETERGIHGKAVLDGSVSDRVEVRIGTELIGRNYDQQYNFDAGSPVALAFNDLLASAFVEGDIHTSNNFVTRLGLRAEYNDLSASTYVDPRLSLAYKTGKNGQMSVAYGRFHQTPRNELLRIDNKLKAETAEHFILNYQHVDNRRTFRVETFYKQYDNLVKYIGGNPNDLDNSGAGFAKGVEFFWRDNRSIRRLDYWVSYSFLKTERNYLNFPYSATPAFASDHNFSVVTKYFVQKLKSQLGATYSFTSGRPYNNPNQEGFNASRTPAYQDLSFNWSYLPKPYLIFYFSCTNLPGYKNVFGYEYSSKPDASGWYNNRPIRQAAPRFLFIGIFLTLSKDKSMTQLPSL